jgi:hypothetical protein
MANTIRPNFIGRAPGQPKRAAMNSTLSSQLILDLVHAPYRKDDGTKLTQDDIATHVEEKTGVSISQTTISKLKRKEASVKTVHALDFHALLSLLKKVNKEAFGKPGYQDWLLSRNVKKDKKEFNTLIKAHQKMRAAEKSGTKTNGPKKSKAAPKRAILDIKPKPKNGKGDKPKKNFFPGAKRCGKCAKMRSAKLNENGLAKDFHRDKKAKDGLRSICKICDAQNNSDRSKRLKGLTPVSSPRPPMSGGPDPSYSPRRVSDNGNENDDAMAIAKKAVNDGMLFTAILHVPDFAKKVLVHLVKDDEDIRARVHEFMAVDQSGL